jgi:hypothetical protein
MTNKIANPLSNPPLSASSRIDPNYPINFE